MAEEFDKLTESDKMRSFVDTSKFREKLAESNSKIFDTELKSLQIDEARMDIGEKSKLYAFNEIERQNKFVSEQDKFKQREYDVKFADASFNATTVDDVNKAAQDFVNKNPGSAFYVRKAVDDRIKEISGTSVTKGQELDLERAKEIQKAQIEYDKSKLKYESLTQGQQKADRRIKLSLESGNIEDAIDRTNVDLPSVYSHFSSKEAARARNSGISPEDRIRLGNDYVRNYGHISNAVKITQQATNEFLRTYGEYLFMANQDPDISSLTGGAKTNKAEFIDTLTRFTTEKDGPLVGDVFFQKLLEKNASDPEKLKRILEMQQDLDQLSDLREPIFELKNIEEEEKAKGELGYNDIAKDRLMTIGRRFSDNAETYVNGRKLEVERTAENLKQQNTEATIKRKEQQTELDRSRIRISQLKSNVEQSRQIYATLIRENIKKGIDATLTEDDKTKLNNAEVAFETALNEFQNFQLEETPSNGSTPTGISDDETF